ncbi:MAG: hypothetical protein H6Q05_4284 [Acidobacteria bacterium]|jgi:uncharacterized protein (UPF0333 family)|nr:hypothetical protein [Acidobacteriota bacterium]
MPNVNGPKMIVGLLLAGMLMISGCSTGEPPADSGKSAVTATPSPAAIAVLAKADAADGTVDKVVSKCVTCMLGMDGNPENSAAYGEYSVHLCSKDCRETFVKDPEKALLALKFPEEK